MRIALSAPCMLVILCVGSHQALAQAGPVPQASVDIKAGYYFLGVEDLKNCCIWNDRVFSRGARFCSYPGHIAECTPDAGAFGHWVDKPEKRCLVGQAPATNRPAE
jgi:hypothetical protein